MIDGSPFANRLSTQGAPFPPYELYDDPAADPRADGLDTNVRRASEKTRKLARLYHQTQAHAWDPRKVLDELEAKHGGIHVPEDKREPLGNVFTILLWGELAAWNVAADLARWLPDVDARMAATGQVFDEARHFTVLRDYLRRAGVVLPPLNPFGRRLLNRIIDTPSMLEKLYGMQLLVETLALGIFKGLATSKIEPVLTDLLEYVERDESRHVALGVLYLPLLLERTTTLDRARNWAFNVEAFLLTIAGGQLLDKDFCALGVDHRSLGFDIQRLHEQTIREMREEHAGRRRITGIYSLPHERHAALIEFLHPERPDAELSWKTRVGRAAMRRALRVAHTALS